MTSTTSNHESDSNIEKNETSIQRRGLFIVFEGVDRSGKTTLTKELIQMMNNDPETRSELMRFPEYSTPTGKIIQQYLQTNDKKIFSKQFIHLTFSANRWECQDTIKTALLSGMNVICDRYSYSGIVFSHVNGIEDLEWCKHSEDGMIEPDMVIYLQIPIDSTQKRPGFGDERYERKEFQERVKKIYEQHFITQKNWVVIDADREQKTVLQDVASRVFSNIIEKKKQNLPLKFIKF